MSEELKPCFCGADVTVNKWLTKMGTTIYQIRCENCGNKGFLYLNRGEAIKAWNGRADNE